MEMEQEECIQKEEEQAEDMEMYLWYIGNTKFENLRNIEGFENLKDLSSVTGKDLEFITKFANSIGVLKDNNERRRIR